MELNHQVRSAEPSLFVLGSAPSFTTFIRRPLAIKPDHEEADHAETTEDIHENVARTTIQVSTRSAIVRR
jgi:hypothetical protein